MLTRCFLWATVTLVFTNVHARLGKHCGVPGRPVDGWFVPVEEVYLPDDRVQYFCDHRYVIFGSVERVCAGNGSWTGSIPTCDLPIAVTTAMQSTTLAEHAATKALDGNYNTCSSTQSQTEGSWTGYLDRRETVIAVKVTLPLEDQVDMEVFVLADDRHPTSCGGYQGYTGVDITKVFYCPQDAMGREIRVTDYRRISHYFQLCEVEVFVKRELSCLIPDVPVNGYGNKRISGKETVFRYFCMEGYRLRGSRDVSCQAFGQWYPAAPTCEAVTCMPPSTVANSSVSYESVEGLVPYGGTANYTCNTGYRASGEVTRTCIDSNVWSGTEPECIPLDCGPLRISIPRGWIETVDGTTVHRTAQLKCEAGYKPLLYKKRVCLPSGKWSDQHLQCEPISCDMPSGIQHGHVRLLDQSLYYGSRMEVVCDEGYTAGVSVLRNCREDGTWGNLVHACRRMACYPSGIPVTVGGNWHHVNDTTDDTAGTVLVLRCVEGYELVGGEPWVTCLSNGTWTLPRVACRQLVATSGFMFSNWGPSDVLIAAVVIGVGTALCIVGAATAFVVMKLRRMSQPGNRSCVHYDLGDGMSHTGSTVSTFVSPEDHYYTSTVYEEVPPPPQRTWSSSSSSHSSKPRKPSIVLPMIPLEADSEYAQPYEPKNTDSIQNLAMDQDSGHIYAEPVDTYSRPTPPPPRLASVSKRRPSSISLQSVRTPGVGSAKEFCWKALDLETAPKLPQRTVERSASVDSVFESAPQTPPTPMVNNDFYTSDSDTPV